MFIACNIFPVYICDCRTRNSLITEPPKKSFKFKITKKDKRFIQAFNDYIYRSYNSIEENRCKS